MRCPRCGAPLMPDPFRMDTLLCDQCGEVEMDGEGAVVGGSFYELADGEDEDENGFGSGVFGADEEEEVDRGYFGVWEEEEDWGDDRAG